MMKVVLIIFAVVQGCLCASLKRQGLLCMRLCPDNWDPICGSDGTTYSNQCSLEAAQCKDSSITAVHTGECHNGHRRAACPDTPCIALWDPVCGSDGVTYGNMCQFNAANCNHNLSVVKHGEC